MHSVQLRSNPAVAPLRSGGIYVLVELECASVLVDLVIVVRPEGVHILHRYGRRIWSL